MKLDEVVVGTMYGYSSWRNATRTNPVLVLAIEQTETKSRPARHNNYRMGPVKRRKVLVQFYDEKALLKGRKVKVGEPKHVDGSELHWTWEAEVARRQQDEQGAAKVEEAQDVAHAAAKKIEAKLNRLTEGVSLSVVDSTTGYSPQVKITLHGQESIDAFLSVLARAGR